MNGEAILITGVSRRVGLYLAQSFNRRGFQVIGTYRRESDKTNELKHSGVDMRACDFFSDEQVGGLISSVQNQYSSLRAIIHNASSWIADADHDLGSTAVLQSMMQIHVYAPFRLNKAFAPLLQKSSSPYSDIIHVGDYVSSRGSQKHIAYAASKAAQDNLTYSFAAKFAPRIKVNSIAPALILFNDDDSEFYRHRALAKSLMHKEAGLEEFKRSVDYILSSSYITGRIHALDGGRHLKQA